MIDLSIIIVSYNTKKLLYFCLKRLLKNLKKQSFSSEIIIIDNNSSDGTVKLLTSLRVSELRIIQNKNNLGFGKANNQGAKIARGKYLLFLNSDIDAGDIDIKKMLNFFEIDKKIAVITPKLILPDGRMDKACHRGFPTLWRSFCYFSGLEKIFGKFFLLNKIFGGYHLLDKNLDSIHEIDSPSGAFYLMKKEVFDEIGGFDSNFFMYGEDLDLSWRIKEKGYKIIYYPKEKAIHLKYQSGLMAKKHEIKKRTKDYFYEAMKIFYQKHYQKKYPSFINKIIFFMIDFFKKNND